MKGLILIYLVTFWACLGSFRYPIIGLATYVGFAVLRPQAIFGWAGDMSGLSLWVGLAALAGWALGGFGNWRFGKGRSGIVFLGLFMAWAVASATFALNSSRAFDYFPVLLKFVIPVLMGVTLLDSPESRRRVFWVMVLAMGYVGFEMNLMYVQGFNAASLGFSGMDNNCFGAALAAMIGPGVALIITSKNWYQRAAASAATLLILHTALLTFSRGTMVGLLAVAAVAFVMMPKRPKHMAALVIVVAIAVRFTGPELLNRYSSTFADAEERDGSAESRVDLWRDCLMVVSQYPVLGVGLANWRVIASQYGWPPGKSAHSVWMETAAETGIPGAFFLLMFFLAPAARLWPIAREKITDANRDDVAIAIGVILSATGFVVAAQFVSVPGLENPYYIVMVGIALLKARSAAAPVPAQAPAAVPTTQATVPSATPVPSPVALRRGGEPLPKPAGSLPRILDLGPRRSPRRV